MRRVPHPIPYQGSKRKLAAEILRFVEERRFRRLYEPFAGSAAITIAGARIGLADEYIIADSLAPLIGIWSAILESPTEFASTYERLWRAQIEGDEDYYECVRREFNQDRSPVKLLYLLARCVKNAPRFNQQGDFNQSPDRRRLGMHPAKMRQEIVLAARLLGGRTTTMADDFESTLNDAGPDDLIYLDPPWQGTSSGRDRRYHEGLTKDRLERVLHELNKRNVAFLLSYDGQCGGKVYGESLDGSLNLLRIELRAGRSTQATLNGRAEETVESLYLSPALRNMGIPTERLSQASLWAY